MKRHQLQVTLEQAGYETQSYSGRSMMGKSCLAVYLTPYSGSIHQVIASTISKFASSLLQENIDKIEMGNQVYARQLASLDDAISRFAEIVSVVSQDSLGKGTIVYWRDVEYQSDFEAGEDRRTGMEDEND